MNKGYNITIIGFFIAILVLPSVAGLIFLLPETANNENRALKTMPAIDMNSLDSIPKEFDEYYGDNFSFRNQLLKLNSKIRFHWFGIPPYNGKAFMGRQGWMFAIKDEMEHFLGNNIFDQDTLNRFIEIINYRKRVLDSLNCQYYLVIAPIKTSIYPEFLPISKRKSGQSNLTDQLMDTLSKRKDIKVIDLRKAFKMERDHIRLFHKTDNHWNEYGGYVAYKAIMDTLSQENPSLHPIDFSNFRIELTETEGKMLSRLMGIYDGVNETEINCKPLFDRKARTGIKSNYSVPDYFPYKNAYESVFVTSDSSKLNLLVIHDSFGTVLHPYLSEHFARSVYIFDGWQHAFNEEILLNERPDIYIQLVSESLLPNIPKNAKKPM